MKFTTGRIVLISAFFAGSISLYSNPAGEQVVSGSATFSRDGGVLEVVTGTDSTIIDWENFSIGVDELTNFVQPGIDSAVLNRVVGSLPTNILGSLVSNGRVAIINPNGVVIDSSGMIDTRGFVGSTLDVTNESFLANGDLAFSGQSGAGVTNNGVILAREGDVFLLGREVSNTGEIIAENGNVGLGAGSRVILKKDGDDHFYIEVAESQEGDRVDNSGRISALREDLRNGADPYAQAMYTGENQDISGVTLQRGGGVFLSAGGEGLVVQSGEIDVSSETTGGCLLYTSDAADE